MCLPSLGSAQQRGTSLFPPGGKLPRGILPGSSGWSGEHHSKPMCFISSPLGFQVNNQRGEKGSSTQVCVSQDKAHDELTVELPKVQWGQSPHELWFWLIIPTEFSFSCHWINCVHWMEEMLLAKREGEKESPYAPSLQTPLLLQNLLQKKSLLKGSAKWVLSNN